MQEDYDRFEKDKLEQENEKLDEDNQQLERENKLLKQQMQQLQALQARGDDRSDTCTILSLSMPQALAAHLLFRAMSPSQRLIHFLVLEKTEPLNEVEG